MFFLQIPAADDIAKDVANTFEGLESEWVDFWHRFIDSPVEGLKYLGSHAVGVLGKIVIALLIFWAGRWLIRKLLRLLRAVLLRRRVDSSIRIFLGYLVSIVLYIMLFGMMVAVMGWNMTGLVAVFAAAAFAVGMALSGTLSNFAGGVLILLLKPFRVGDYIEAQGFGGTVNAIELFHTTIHTPDNKTVVMPNSVLSTGIVDNVSRQPTRMVEWKVGICYGDDFAQAEKIARAILAGDPRVLKDREIVVVINEMTASGLVVLARAWVATPDYWPMFWDTNRRLYEQFSAAGIRFPATQIDVKLTK
jgi:small conductance mechanosensitive channel